jgi:ABC-type glycerol-3-phosphate transport system permease component
VTVRGIGSAPGPAPSMLAVVPPVTVLIVMQRRFVKGLETEK